MTVDDIINDPQLSRVADELRSLKRLSIRIYTTVVEEDSLPIGASKIGGRPDLPPGMVWPMRKLNVPTPSEGFLKTHPETPVLPEDGKIALPFIAQLRMSDLAAYDIDQKLPKSGMLYFFYNTVMYMSDTGEDAKIHDSSGYSYCEYDFFTPANYGVFDYDGDLSELTRASLPDRLLDEVRYGACALRFENEWTLPHVETCFIGFYGSNKGKLILNNDEWEIYADLRHEWRTRSIFQMLGHSDDAQPSAMEGEYRVIRDEFFPSAIKFRDLSKEEQQQEWEQGRLLLELDCEENGMTFGRDGRLYFFIRESDLAAKDFSKVWAREQ